jgi:hypothetical protein
MINHIVITYKGKWIKEELLKFSETVLRYGEFNSCIMFGVEIY